MQDNGWKNVYLNDLYNAFLSIHFSPKSCIDY